MFINHKPMNIVLPIFPHKKPVFKDSITGLEVSEDTKKSLDAISLDGEIVAFTEEIVGNTVNKMKSRQLHLISIKKGEYHYSVYYWLNYVSLREYYLYFCDTVMNLYTNRACFEEIKKLSFCDFRFKSYFEKLPYNKNLFDVDTFLNPKQKLEINTMTIPPSAIIIYLDIVPPSVNKISSSPEKIILTVNEFKNLIYERKNIKNSINSKILLTTISNNQPVVKEYCVDNIFYNIYSYKNYDTSSLCTGKKSNGCSHGLEKFCAKAILGKACSVNCKLVHFLEFPQIY